MSSIFGFIRKKFQPIKRQFGCSSVMPTTGSPASIASFDEGKPSPMKSRQHHALNNRSKAIRKSSKSSTKTKKNAVKARNAVEKTPDDLKKINKPEKCISPSKLLFDSPTPKSIRSMRNETSNGAYVSSIDCNRDNMKSMEGDHESRLIFESISNVLTPNSSSSQQQENASGQSMRTFKTAFVAVKNSFDDDGLIQSTKQQQQQSTPNGCFGFAHKNIPLRRSSTINQMREKPKAMVKEESSIAVEPRREIKQPNATYTIHERGDESDRAATKKQEHPHNSRIVDYLRQLEIRRAVKRKTNTSRIAKKKTLIGNDSIARVACVETKEERNEEEKQVEGEKTTAEDDEIERIQDEFFSDGSLTPKPPSPAKMHVSDLHTTSSPISSASSNSFTSASRSSLVKLDFKIEENENMFMNKSIEKIRRTASSPKLLENLNSSASAVFSTTTHKMNTTMTALTAETNESGALTISDIPMQTSPMPLPSATTTEAMIHDDDDAHDDLEGDESREKQHFVRGEPSTRLSTNIKRMFKDVIERQTSALHTLERFYETQISVIEAERASMLTAVVCDDHKKRINTFYDQQLSTLEKRVQNNLKKLLESKASFQSKPPNQAANRMTQIMLMKQMQQQQQQQQQLRGHQSRTRTLSGLKASLVSANQTSLLPSKVAQVRRFAGATANEDAEKTTSSGDEQIVGNSASFKRNLSLPFKQTRQIIPDDKEKEPKSPMRTYKQAYSSANYTTNGYCAILPPPAPTMTNAMISPSPSPMNLVALPQQTQQRQLAKVNAFVKNSAQKKQQFMMLESLRRATSNNGDEADDEDSGFKSSFMAYSQTKRDGSQARSATIRKTQPLNFETFNVDTASIYSLKSACCHEINHGQHPQQNLMKYLSPRLSDGHLQYKVKFAEYHRNMNFNQDPAPRLFHSSSHNQISSMHETEV